MKPGDLDVLRKGLTVILGSMFLLWGARIAFAPVTTYNWAGVIHWAGFAWFDLLTLFVAGAYIVVSGLWLVPRRRSG